MTTTSFHGFSLRDFVLLALITAILFLMSFTPLGYLNVGPLAITLNVVPVAIAAVALGPAGGAVAGAVFGLTSCIQCINGGAGVFSATLFAIDPALTIVQRFFPRLLDGFLLGWIFRLVGRRTNPYLACSVTGFCSAFLNTVFFMTALLLLFGRTDFIQEKIGGRNWLVFSCAFVGVNAVAEMAASTILTGAIGSALIRAGLVKPKLQ